MDGVSLLLYVYKLHENCVVVLTPSKMFWRLAIASNMHAAPHTSEDLPCLFIFREHGTSEGGILDLHAVLSCTGVIVCTNCGTKNKQKHK